MSFQNDFIKKIIIFNLFNNCYIIDGFTFSIKA